MNYLLEGEEAFVAISSYIKNLFIPSEDNNHRPKFLQSRALLYVVVFICIAKILTVSFFLPVSKNIFFADITKIDLLNLLNQNRQEYGLNPLVENETLDQAARLKAQDMIDNGYFSHESPKGISPWFWFKKAGYEYKYAGENLAVGFADSEVVYNAWFASPSHKDNLLNENYKEVGTAIVQGFGENGSIVVVQLFGSQLPVPKPVVAATRQNVKPVPKAPVVTQPEPIKPPVDNGTTGGAKEVAAQEAPLPSDQEAPVAENELVSARVLAESTEYPLLSEPNASAKNSLYFKFLNFIVYDNNRILQLFSYGLLAVMTVCLIINIFLNFEIQHAGLIVRSLVLISILYASTFIDRDIILQIMPHHVII